MMGKIHTAKNFRESLRYCLDDKKQKQSQQIVFKDRAEVLYYHQCHGNIDELVQQFNEVSRLNLNVLKPVMTIFLSLPPEESVAKSKLVQLAKECAVHMDFGKNQYVAILHKDTSHQHIHLVANRISFDRHLTSDSFCQQKLHTYCREAEIRHHLTQTLNPMSFRTPEERQVPRHDVKLDLLRENIRQSLLLSHDVAEFKVQMEGRGYTVYQKPKGMAFMVDKYVVFKGSEAGYPFHKIQSILSRDLSLRQEEERQRLEQVQRQQQEQGHRQEQRQRHIQSQQLSL